MRDVLSYWTYAPSACGDHSMPRRLDAFRASVQTDWTCVAVARNSPSASPDRYAATSSVVAGHCSLLDVTSVTASSAMSLTSESVEDSNLNALSILQASLVSAATGIPAAPAEVLPYR